MEDDPRHLFFLRRRRNRSDRRGRRYRLSRLLGRLRRRCRRELSVIDHIPIFLGDRGRVIEADQCAVTGRRVIQDPAVIRIEELKPRMRIVHIDITRFSIRVARDQIADGVSRRYAQHAKENRGGGRIVHTETTPALGQKPRNKVLDAFRRIRCLGIVRVDRTDELDDRRHLLCRTHGASPVHDFEEPLREHAAFEDARTCLLRDLQADPVDLIFEVLGIPVRLRLLRRHVICIVIGILSRITDLLTEIPVLPDRDTLGFICRRDEEIVHISGDEIHVRIHICLYLHDEVRFPFRDVISFREEIERIVRLSGDIGTPGVPFHDLHTAGTKIDHTAASYNGMVLVIVEVSGHLQDLHIRRVKESGAGQIFSCRIRVDLRLIFFILHETALISEILRGLLFEDRLFTGLPDMKLSSDPLHQILHLRELFFRKEISVVPFRREDRPHEKTDQKDRDRDLQHTVIRLAVPEPLHVLEDKKEQHAGNRELSGPGLRHDIGDRDRGDKERDVEDQREENVPPLNDHICRKIRRYEVDEDQKKRDVAFSLLDLQGISIDRLECVKSISLEDRIYVIHLRMDPKDVKGRAAPGDHEKEGRHNDAREFTLLCVAVGRRKRHHRKREEEYVGIQFQGMGRGHHAGKAHAEDHGQYGGKYDRQYIRLHRFLDRAHLLKLALLSALLELFFLRELLRDRRPGPLETVLFQHFFRLSQTVSTHLLPPPGSAYEE